jgi:hypothetical protein
MKALEEKPVFEKKPAAKKKKKQSKTSEPEEQEEAIPTAMELALREAMEKNQSDDEGQVETKSKSPAADPELDQILSRTLEHKVKTASE